MSVYLLPLPNCRSTQVSLRISAHRITAPTSPHYAVRDEETAYWLVTYLPGRLLDLGTALAALCAAELAADGAATPSDDRWELFRETAEDLGLSGPQAVSLLRCPPHPIASLIEGATP